MLDKKYSHLDVELNRYQFWLDNDLFKAGKVDRDPFCIVIPPPNVTGRLHLGHAWDTTLQDIITRYKRMDGYDALWVPGMDHAGIATQAKVDARLREEGIDPRSMDRNDWLERAWSWKEEYASVIRNQWAKLGLSLDYSRECFTMDENLSEAVKKVFVDLYNKGYIYRGERIINFDPVAMTALSNIEVIYKEVEGAFYHLKYMIEGTNDYLEVATTRPETLFGDTAVAVNPKDERYKHLIGQSVILPLVNKKIPIIGDFHADMSFGTGVVKITPAHDPNDFEVGNRHNLERVRCINADGKMNENALNYNGLNRFECRKMVVKDLEDAGLLLKTKKIKHSVGHSERSGAMVEPYLSKQWFVKMDDLAEKALSNQLDKDTKVNFIPKRFETIFSNWMKDVQDWCISRQLWWGHQIPAWYKDDEIYVGMEAPEGEDWIQDVDVLDTWFSSALWPFATLGWPNNFDERYFPNNVLVTGYDIIFFWVSRMIFQSLEFTGQRPFKDVLIHGLIRDKEGRKMSKSLGNGVDPMDVIENYGADALRFFLTTNSAPGQDLRYDEDKVKSSWNFINKLWNASRFVLMNLEDFKETEFKLDNLSISDKWIIYKLNETIKVVRKNMDKYEFNVTGNTLYNFVWNDFCDWYIELSKTDLDNQTTKAVLLHVLTNTLQLLHPFVPYVTEEIYQMLPIHEKSIMTSLYPIYDKQIRHDKDVTDADKIIEIITKIRTTKQENNIGSEYFILNNLNDSEAGLINNNMNIFNKLLKGKIVNSFSSETKKINILFPYGTIILGYIGTDNDEDIKVSLNKEKELLLNNIARREKLLSNEGYINKAPKEIVLEERNKLSEEKDKIMLIDEKLKDM
ncbi:MAG: valine--tRNA ligase [Bacilli bacterium]|nr:valine--tRNA ligase [Bacilli bacterium]MDD3305391.1 valine--tRNA ligase [Bacilli bacterium]MDD4053952.1 valine--tRNA ligase [Bacilli bacterium]MDD4411212.1 valine--tRNA ligase [Bacilli bacterium]